MASVDTIYPVGLPLSKVVHFKSVGRTGTGALETIPHYMGEVPSLVLVSLRDVSGANTYVIGTYTSANLLVTVTNAAVYDIVALFDY